MTITVTDQPNSSETHVYRAEMTDAQGRFIGLGFGMTKTEAVAEAWQDCIERVERNAK